MIYTVNTTGHLLYPVAKLSLNLSDNDVYEMINQEFSIMTERLKLKGIKYNELKRALIPNQDKDNNEVCLVFDSTLIESSIYGYEIFSNLIPLLDRKSTYSILAGDYIDILSGIADAQLLLKNELNEKTTKYNASVYQHSSQYYLVYINSITNGQLSMIITGLQKYKWFCGYALLNTDSKFKTYLSCILSPICIKNKSSVILGHPSDFDDNENINMVGYPFEENSYRVVSINDDSFGPFLSYKIESIVPDKDDISFSFNALFQKFDSMEKLKLNITDKKWGYLNGEDNGKCGILESFDFENISKANFTKIVFKKICSNYIYNLRTNEYGDYLFNVCVELPTKKGNIRRTTVALKYIPACGEIAIVTIT